MINYGRITDGELISIAHTAGELYEILRDAGAAIDPELLGCVEHIAATAVDEIENRYGLTPVGGIEDTQQMATVDLSPVGLCARCGEYTVAVMAGAFVCAECQSHV